MTVRRLTGPSLDGYSMAGQSLRAIIPPAKPVFLESFTLISSSSRRVMTMSDQVMLEKEVAILSRTIMENVSMKTDF